MSIASAAAISPRPSTATLVLLASLYCAQGLPSGLIADAMLRFSFAVLSGGESCDSHGCSGCCEGCHGGH